MKQGKCFLTGCHVHVSERKIKKQRGTFSQHKFFKYSEAQEVAGVSVSQLLSYPAHKKQ